MAKLAEVVPVGIVTLAGGVAAGELDDRIAVKAGRTKMPERVNVPVEDVPPVTEFGETARVVEYPSLGVTVTRSCRRYTSTGTCSDRRLSRRQNWQRGDSKRRRLCSRGNGHA